MKTLYILFTLLIVGSCNFLKSQANLIASYNFNSGSAMDNSGNNYTGSFYGVSAAVDTLTIGYNTSDYFSVPSQVLNSRVQFSIVFKIKFTGFNTTSLYPTNTIFSSDNNSSTGIFAFSYQKDINSWRFGNGVTAFDFFDNSIIIGKWYCVTLTRDNIGSMKLYVDGVQNATVNSYATPINITSFIVGQETDCFAGCFAVNQSGNEKFDDIRFYDNALTPMQISSNCFTLIGINEYQKYQITIYPNPLNGNVLKLKNINALSNFSIEVLSVDGKKLKELNFINELELSIDMSDIKPGIYLIKTTHDSQSSVIKFIKE
jgi:hypothetical protein